ncbi:hypothetical protein CALCODRAFT_72822 [Calocera cornea HHB12733]|uniref:Uncharacterized protein n=1 Tax=Calocera cornea HHB12733 TaxID=1353952 RepID=A0A165ITK3_9BASI|nr:hypothetical protein CALCODRAFT_72822 [Calocera cornea HHB12733]
MRGRGSVRSRPACPSPPSVLCSAPSYDHGPAPRPPLLAMTLGQWHPHQDGRRACRALLNLSVTQRQYEALLYLVCVASTSTSTSAASPMLWCASCLAYRAEATWRLLLSPMG